MEIFQKPNKSSVIAFIGIILSVFTHGILHNITLVLGVFSGIIWSHQEVTTGVNKIRKIFGLIGFLALTLYLYQNLK